MELGGLRTSDRRVFLLSTTHGPETVGLSAYLAVHREYSEWDVVATMERQGARLADGIRAATHDAGLADVVRVHGRPSCLVFSTAGPDGAPSQEYRTLFLQELLRAGVLGQSFVVSAAHTDADIDQTVEVVRAALQVYARALEQGTTDGFLKGRPVAPAMREFASPRQLPPMAPHL
jgi:glutamate-1-semialdehyde 2,1-aminomutase